jgi:hypothetical protein
MLAGKRIYDNASSTPSRMIFAAFGSFFSRSFAATDRPFLPRSRSAYRHSSRIHFRQRFFHRLPHLSSGL